MAKNAISLKILQPSPLGAKALCLSGFQRVKVLRATFTSRNPYKHRGFRAIGEGWRKKHVIYFFWSCGLFYFSYLRVASRQGVTPLWHCYYSAVTPLFGLTRSSVLYLHQKTVVVMSLYLLLGVVNRATTKFKDSCWLTVRTSVVGLWESAITICIKAFVCPSQAFERRYESFGRTSKGFERKY